MQHPRLGMCSPPDSIPILQMLARLTEARLIVEVGVFTGYATLGMALALPSDGTLIACDVSREYTSIGVFYCSRSGPPAIRSADMSRALCRRSYRFVHVVPAGQPHWEAAGVADNIDLRIAPATQTLNAMLEVVDQCNEHAHADTSGHSSCIWIVCNSQMHRLRPCSRHAAAQWFPLTVQAGKQGTVDLAFIDADKPSYGQYYELLLQLLRPGGVIAVHAWRCLHLWHRDSAAHPGPSLMEWCATVLMLCRWTTFCGAARLLTTTYRMKTPKPSANSMLRSSKTTGA